MSYRTEQQRVAFATLEQDTRQFFDNRMADAIKAYMEEKDSVPKGSALRAIRNEVIKETTEWVRNTALPFAQEQVMKQMLPNKYDAEGKPLIPAPQLQSAPTTSLPTSLDGYDIVTDPETGVTTFTPKQ